nr:hypothetical protein [Ornithinimicrobium sp. INDO-MA30-4]
MAVVGRPHPELGEEIAAYVVLAPDQKATGEEISAYVKERVAPISTPATFTSLRRCPRAQPARSSSAN